MENSLIYTPGGYLPQGFSIKCLILKVDLLGQMYYHCDGEDILWGPGFMKYRIVFIIALLMLVILTGLLLIKSAEMLPGIISIQSFDIFTDLDKKLINYLEKTYQVELKAEEVVVWPVNQIMLKKVQITAETGDFSIYVPEMKAYYNLLQYLTGGKPLISVVNQIKLVNPVIELNDDITSTKDDSGKISGYDLDRLTNELFKTAPFQIIVEDGSLLYKNKKNKNRLKNINLTFKVLNKKECRLALKTDALLNDVNWNELMMKKPEINDIELVMVYTGEDWQGVVETGFFQIPEINGLDRLSLSDRQKMPFTIADLDGRLKSKIYFSGSGLSLDVYQVAITLSGIDGRFKDMDNLNYIIDSRVDNNHPLAGFKILDGNIYFDSRDKMINGSDLEFKVADSYYRFNGNLQLAPGNTPKIYGHLNSNNLNLEDFDFLSVVPPELKASGDMALELTLEGTLSEVDLALDLTIPEGNLNKYQFKNLRSSLRYHGNNIYLDKLDFELADGNLFKVSGIYNYLTQNYNFQLNTDSIAVGVLKDLYFDFIDVNKPDNKKGFIEKLTNFKGDIKFNSSVTGKGFQLENIKAAGELQINGLLTNNNRHFNQLKTRFYLADKRLLLENGILVADWGEINFSGETGISEKETLDIQLTGQKLDIGDIKTTFLSETFVKTPPAGDMDQSGLLSRNILNNISGKAGFEAHISGNTTSPVLTGSINVNNAHLADYNFDDLSAKLNYRNGVISLDQLDMVYRETSIKGEGKLEFLEDNTLIDFNFLTSDVVYDIANQILLEHNVIKTPLPLKGSVEANLNIKGDINKPRLKGYLSSLNTTLEVENKDIVFDYCELTFEKSKQGIQINDFKVNRGDAFLFASGNYLDDKLDINFNLTDYPLAEIYPDRLEGKVQLKGRLIGSSMKPEINSQVIAREVKYLQQDIGKLEGNISFDTEVMKVDSLAWFSGNNKYTINGEIKNIFTDPLLALQMETTTGSIKDFMFPGFNTDFKQFSIPEDYYFEGLVTASGELSNILGELDLTFYSKDNKAMKVSVIGKAGKQIEFDLQGENVEIKNLIKTYKDGEISGLLDFSGSLTGSIGEIEAKLTTAIKKAQVGEFPIESINGKLELISGKKIHLNQKMLLGSNCNLNVRGQLPLSAGFSNINLQVDMQDFPLSLLSAYYPGLPVMDGKLSGNIAFAGSPEKPDLSGNATLRDGKIDFNLPDVFKELNGELDLSGNEIEVTAINGKYGDGDVILKGLIKPFSEENWDLHLTGKQCPFNYGSFTGRFDPDLKISGTFYAPSLKADLYTYNLTIGLPVEWPASSEEKVEYPDFDITIYPGEDVYLSNQNIKVMIQEGSLNITAQDNQIEFEGILDSEQGTFDYYNNKFIVEEARAVFERYSGYIPKLDVKAWTNISGTRVEVQINGKADNMITVFRSSPPLSEKEILALLTSKGGIGEFVSGNWENIFAREIFRILHSKLQLDFVDELQTSFKDIFKLDRFEVDTYNLGWDNQIAIYIGKYFSEKLYLEYTSVMTPEERDGELSLRYYFTDNLLFKGSWRGDEDYSLSIETNLKF